MRTYITGIGETITTPEGYKIQVAAPALSLVEDIWGSLPMSALKPEDQTPPKPAITKPEAYLYWYLGRQGLTKRYVGQGQWERITKLEEDWRADALDLVIAKSWIVSYVSLASSLGLYKVSAGSQAVSSAAISTIVSTAFSLVGGPVSVVLSFIAGLARIILSAIGTSQKIEEARQRSIVANQQIYAKIGPPPAILDQILIHISAAFRNLSVLQDPDYEDINTLWSPPGLMEFGVLLALEFYKKQGTLYPPLPPKAIQTIARLWTQNQIQFLPPAYMTDGPVTRKNPAKTPLTKDDIRRKMEAYYLAEYYKRRPNLVDLDLKQTLPLYPRPASDRTRLLQLKRITGL